MYRFCLLLCHDPALAQDLMQDTYVRALGEIRKLKDAKKFVGWLHQIAKNLFLDHIKSPKNAATVPLHEEDRIESSQADFNLHLREALARLVPEDRYLLLLVDLAEHSYKEAAEIIGVSESTVRFRLHQIRKEFSKHYDR